MSQHYTVSARKYRPDSFASMVGQEATANTLRTAILSGKIAHAYLFCGPRGVGKTTAARVLAKTLNCEAITPEGEACNHCESCNAFNQQRSFSIFEFDAASNNSVEDIRSLIEQVASPPALGRYKIYIIDEVHMLSQGAFNAFLKTLEEPPSYAIFILATTEKHKILPTILSRCQVYDFRRIGVRDIAHHLQFVAQEEGIQADEQALGLIAERADGGMRDALSMFDRIASYSEGHITYQNALDSLNILDHTYYIRMLEGCLAYDYRGELLLVDELLGKGFDGQVILSGFASFLRDLLVAQHADTLRLLEKPQSLVDTYHALAQRCSYAQLREAIGALVEADQKYKSASSKRLLLEMTILGLLKLFSSPSAEPSPQPQPSREVTPAPISSPPPSEVAPSSSGQSQSSVQVETTPSVQNSEPIVQATEPTPAPVPVVSAQVEELHRGRKQLRGLLNRRLGSSEPKASDASPSVAPDVVEAEEVTLEQVQRAWQAFLHQEIPQDEIITREVLSQGLPQLVEPLVVEYAHYSGVAQQVEKVHAHLQQYLRKSLHNSSLRLQFRSLRPEEMPRSAMSREERFAELLEHYPDLQTLSERLSLRLL